MSEPRVYAGRVYVRPVGRGVVLCDIDADLDEWIAGALGEAPYTGGGAERRARITVERLAGPGGHPAMTDDTQQQPALALTAAERAEIRDEHYQLPIGGSCAGCTYGDGRGSELGWPCPTIRLLDALDASERRVGQERSVAETFAEASERHRGRAEQAEAERDALAREVGALRAALAAPSAGGEDGRS